MCLRRRLVTLTVMVIVNAKIIVGRRIVIDGRCAQSIWTISLKYSTALLIDLERVVVVEGLSVSIEAEILFGIRDGGEEREAAFHLFSEVADFGQFFLS